MTGEFLRAAVRTRARPRLAERVLISDRKIVGEDIKDVEFAWPIGMPLCRTLDGGLWEVRSDLTTGESPRAVLRPRRPHGAAARVHQEEILKKTPASELDLAMKRKKDLR